MEGAQGPTLRELVELYQGDPNRWAAELCKRLYRTVDRLTTGVALPSDPQALANEVIMKLMQVDCSGVRSMEAYVVSALKNRIRDAMRQETRRRAMHDELARSRARDPEASAVPNDARLELESVQDYFQRPPPPLTAHERTRRGRVHTPLELHARWRTVFQVAVEVLGSGGSLAHASREASARLGQSISVYEFRKEFETLVRKALATAR